MKHIFPDTRCDLRLLFCACIGCLAAVTACGGEDIGSEEAGATQLGPPKRWAPDQADAKANEALWAKYCIGDPGVTVRPVPNYADPLVMKAATQLGKIWRHSFALYSDIKKHHASAVPAELNGKVKQEAHDFLTYLCGEFRDRATMVEAKLRWVGERMNYLSDKDKGPYDPAGDPWMQMKKAEYHPYLAVSSALFAAKRDDLADQGKGTVSVGGITADAPVPPQTVCETKYMFAEYVKKARSFDDYASFKTGYAAFRSKSCKLPDEENYYYDFRGDSNIKPNSPESNGMIWFARTITRQCSSKDPARAYQDINPGAGVTVQACRIYFRYPFNSRYNAARAGLAAWTVIDPNLPGLDSNSAFTVIPRAVSDANCLFGDRSPYRALDQSGQAVPLLAGYATYFKKGDFGLGKLLGGDQGKLEKLLQLDVDRHTDWYSSGYNDQMPLKPLVMTQAYSPFVASSYEMSESDNFVTPGVTVTGGDPSANKYKHWMFIFRVHKDNWFTPESVAAGKTPDFDRVWLDETSFGDSSLANSEKAWDRLGTSLEAEHDALLYLHNLPAD